MNGFLDEWIAADAKGVSILTSAAMGQGPASNLANRCSAFRDSNNCHAGEEQEEDGIGFERTHVGCYKPRVLVRSVGIGAMVNLDQ